MDGNLIVVRGAGDLASGVIHTLAGAGFRVLALETAHPAAIRRQVCFCEAVYEGEATVEGLTAVRIDMLSDAEAVWKAGKIPVLVDPQCRCLDSIRPMALVDAILAKRNLGTNRAMAPLTVALGPGFCAGRDVDAVIETCRGHDLGRIIVRGCARPNTGCPGIIGGFGRERVIHAPAAGVMQNVRAIGDIVDAGEIIAWVAHEGEKAPVTAKIPGVLRGLIRDGFSVHQGMKIADVDPRLEERENCFTISDKSRCIAGSVLKLVCAQQKFSLSRSAPGESTISGNCCC